MSLRRLHIILYHCSEDSDNPKAANRHSGFSQHFTMRQTFRQSPNIQTGDIHIYSPMYPRHSIITLQLSSSKMWPYPTASVDDTTKRRPPWPAAITKSPTTLRAASRSTDQDIAAMGSGQAQARVKPSHHDRFTSRPQCCAMCLTARVPGATHQSSLHGGSHKGQHCGLEELSLPLYPGKRSNRL